MNVIPYYIRLWLKTSKSSIINATIYENFSLDRTIMKLGFANIYSEHPSIDDNKNQSRCKLHVLDSLYLVSVIRSFNCEI